MENNLFLADSLFVKNSVNKFVNEIILNISFKVLVLIVWAERAIFYSHHDGIIQLLLLLTTLENQTEAVFVIYMMLTYDDTS